jgi:oligopeptide/dipeptide ABC transporter ATP-binding protein
MIFQDPGAALKPFFTVGRQIADVIVSHKDIGLRAAREAAIEALRLVHLPDPELAVDRYPHQLSGGQLQRAMIAMAMACGPDLLIADEPTTALDVTIQAQILQLMKDLTDRLGVALILITHNLGVVARYADRVNIMYAGKIIEAGTTEHIYADPKHPYTIGLLGSVPRIDSRRGERLTPIDGQPPDLARLDDGCAYRPRCNWAVEECARSFPPLEALDDGHRSACFRKEAL